MKYFIPGMLVRDLIKMIVHGTFVLVLNRKGYQVMSYILLRQNEIRLKINGYDNIKVVLSEIER